MSWSGEQETFRGTGHSNCPTFIPFALNLITPPLRKLTRKACFFESCTVGKNTILTKLPPSSTFSEGIYFAKNVLNL